jgi:hypothetical protein
MHRLMQIVLPNRADLKRQYNICAYKEMQSLGIQDRSDGIPSLVVLAATGDVITRTGVKDIREQGAAAIDTWLNTAAAAAAPSQSSTVIKDATSSSTSSSSDSQSQQDTNFCVRGGKC